MQASDPEDLRRIEAEEAAAAAEAAAIGGPRSARSGDDVDPEMGPVYEAGGGEAEGFELAEAELIENASHGDGVGDPLADAFSPEAESDYSTAAYGQRDDEDVSELVEDPETGPEDPGAGPGIALER